ncbi:HlyC/CorC family transporter [Haloterrigena sp. SYSU A558-1]|uniref:HlyC/CorC family transporter n=1 Tax=Haloterrigena gelatinilytica TaxID=2741724 RepID=A0ABX2L650_9EURY|nr:hemolysin family protein [Haloterrigena gelatinilytica]NUC71740.1 HlyC/CorC family transporter [Haloterrigena gelatinilytica]
MQAPEILLRLIAGAALILANGFFVTIEFALTRARQYSKSEFMEPGLERAWEMTEELEIYLTGCQVGITACSIALGIVAEPALAALFEPLFGGTVLASIGAGVILAYIIVSLVHKVYGEQAPTYLGVERSKQVCRYGATPLYWFTLVIRPILRVGDWVAKWTLSLFGVEMTGAWLESDGEEIEGRADLHRQLGLILDDNEIPDERRQEVMNALVVEEIPIRDIMVPREEITALSTDNTPEENLATVEEYPHLRYPLVGEDIDDFRGVVYLAAITNQFEAFKNGDIDIEDLAESPMTLRADEVISDAIDRFQTESQELALVTEEGRVVGLLTSTDAFEEVMGELEDPIDVYQREQRRDDTSGLDSQSDPA